MKHVVLLGDSVFDNAAYVAGGPDVIQQLRQKLPRGWKATLEAVDGSLTDHVPVQLQHVPDDASHLIISVGGNDVLVRINFLNERVHSISEALERLTDIADQFEDRYSAMLEKVLNQGLPTALCTIYYPRNLDPPTQRIAVAALAVFDDVILRQACSAGLPVLDLRLICTEASDYANPIEPSTHGGDKIATEIVRLLEEHDFDRRRTEVFIS